MKILLIDLSAVCVAAIFAPIVSADDNAAFILDKAIVAIGGREQLDKMKGYELKAKIESGSSNPNSSKRDYSEIRFENESFCSTIEGDSSLGFYRTKVVMQENRGWMETSLGAQTIPDYIDLDERIIKNKKSHAFFTANANMLLLILLKNQSIRYIGERQYKFPSNIRVVSNSDLALVIEVVDERGKRCELWFDKDTHLLVKQRYKRYVFVGVEQTEERLFSDYRDFDGIKVATTRTISYEEEPIHEITRVTTFKRLTELPAEKFRKK